MIATACVLSGCENNTKFRNVPEGQLHAVFSYKAKQGFAITQINRRTTAFPPYYAQPVGACLMKSGFASFRIPPGQTIVSAVGLHLTSGAVTGTSSYHDILFNCVAGHDYVARQQETSPGKILTISETNPNGTQRVIVTSQKDGWESSGFAKTRLLY